MPTLTIDTTLAGSVGFTAALRTALAASTVMQGTGALTAQLAQLTAGSATLAGAGALTVDLELFQPTFGFTGGVTIAGQPQDTVSIGGRSSFIVKR